MGHGSYICQPPLPATNQAATPSHLHIQDLRPSTDHHESHRMPLVRSRRYRLRSPCGRWVVQAIENKKNNADREEQTSAHLPLHMIMSAPALTERLLRSAHLRLPMIMLAPALTARRPRSALASERCMLVPALKGRLPRSARDSGRCMSAPALKGKLPRSALASGHCMSDLVLMVRRRRRRSVVSREFTWVRAPRARPLTKVVGPVSLRMS